MEISIENFLKMSLKVHIFIMCFPPNHAIFVQKIFFYDELQKKY